MRRLFRLCVLACALSGAAAACGSSGNSPFVGSDGGATVPDGGSMINPDGSIGNFGDGSALDGTMNCSSSSPDMTGCQCHSGDTRPCYTGSASTRGVGACTDGVQSCVQSGEFGIFGPCMNETLPTPEGGHCTDGVDNDCNGLTDCQDPACVKDPACQSPPDASDGPAPPPQDGGCTPPLVSVTGEMRCPNGTVLQVGMNGLCCPCTIDDCPTAPDGSFPSGNYACCAAAACANASACTSCPSAVLDPECNGMVDHDCDDFPEDCDQLCCPCKPGSCGRCPQGQVECPLPDGTMVCTNVATSDATCGACDTQCYNGQHCMNGLCM